MCQFVCGVAIFSSKSYLLQQTNEFKGHKCFEEELSSMNHKYTSLCHLCLLLVVIFISFGICLSLSLSCRIVRIHCLALSVSWTISFINHEWLIYSSNHSYFNYSLSPKKKLVHDTMTNTVLYSTEEHHTCFCTFPIGWDKPYTEIA